LKFEPICSQRGYRLNKSKDVKNNQNLGLDILTQSAEKALKVAQERLSAFLGLDVTMSVPKIVIPSYSDSELRFEVGDFERDGVGLIFSGHARGSSYLLFDSSNVGDLIASVTGEDPSGSDFSEIHDDFLKEMGNIVLNGCVGSLSNEMNGKLEFEVPKLCSGKIEDFTKNGFKGNDQEICFVGIGLFNIDKLGISGSISFMFYFDDIDDIT